MDEVRERMEVSRTSDGWAVSGEIDASTSPELADALSTIPPECLARELVVLDMAGVDFIDSSGLRVLIDLSNRAREQDVQVALRSPSRAVAKLVEITGLHGLFSNDGTIRDGPAA
jgi:anti-sigma B factor antagonist